MPGPVAAAIERLLGSRVVHATSQPGGFSDGLAVRVLLHDGRRAFIKAIDAATSPAVGAFHRREIVVSGVLPTSAAVPRLLGSYDDERWVALIFEDVEAVLPGQPWRPGELDRVLWAATELAERLTPAPPLEADWSPRLGGWMEIVGDAAVLARLSSLADWVVDDLETHLDLEAGLAAAIGGNTLVHGDLYPFNVLLGADRVLFVDWPHAWIGPRCADVVMLLGSVALSGIDPEPFAAQQPLLVDVEPEVVDTLISAQAGFLLARGCSAAPTADPHLVNMMVALGLASARWFSTRRRAARR